MELQEESPGLRAHLEGLQRAHCSLTSRFKQIEQKLDALDGLLCTDGNDSLEIVSKMFCQLHHMRAEVFEDTCLTVCLNFIC